MEYAKARRNLLAANAKNRESNNLREVKQNQRAMALWRKEHREDIAIQNGELFLAVTVGAEDYAPCTYKTLREAIENLTDTWLADMEAGLEDEVVLKFTSQKMKKSDFDALPEWDGP